MSNKELIDKAREWVRSGHARGESGYVIGTLADALEAAQEREVQLQEALFDCYVATGSDTDGDNAQEMAQCWKPYPRLVVEAVRGFVAESEDEYEHLEAERDALAAKLDAIQKAANVAYPGPNDTDAGLMRIAADHLEHGYPVGGSNLTAAVIRVLREVAIALDSAPADHLNTVKVEHEALLRQSLANRDDAIDKRRRVAELEAAQADVWDEGWHAFGRYIRRLEDAEAAGWGVNITEPQNPYRGEA